MPEFARGSVLGFLWRGGSGSGRKSVGNRERDKNWYFIRSAFSDKKIKISSQLGDQNLEEILARDRKERPIAPQAPAGYPHFLTSRPIFRKARRGRKKRISEERRTPPPELRRNMRLVVANNRAFLPVP